jgi:hypothetical protein
MSEKEYLGAHPKGMDEVKKEMVREYHENLGKDCVSI